MGQRPKQRVALERARIVFGKSYFCKEINCVWPLEQEDYVWVKQMLEVKDESAGPRYHSPGRAVSWVW